MACDHMLHTFSTCFLVFSFRKRSLPKQEAPGSDRVRHEQGVFHDRNGISGGRDRSRPSDILYMPPSGLSRGGFRQPRLALRDASAVAVERCRAEEIAVDLYAPPKKALKEYQPLDENLESSEEGGEAVEEKFIGRLGIPNVPRRQQPRQEHVADDDDDEIEVYCCW